MSCSCHDQDPLIPQIAVIKEVRVDTHDVTTFKIVDNFGKKPFEFLPGQCAMISIPPIGEAIFSITSSPSQEEFIECSIKKCRAPLYPAQFFLVSRPDFSRFYCRKAWNKFCICHSRDNNLHFIFAINIF